MENIEVIILSVIVTILFSLFLGLTIRELNNPQETLRPSDESGPRANLVKFLGRCFDSPTPTKVEENKTTSEEEKFIL